MEHIALELNNVELYDHLCHGPTSLMEGGDLKIVTKDKGTIAGNPIALIAFTVLDKEGKPIGTAQAATTVKLLRAVLTVLNGRYPPPS